MPINTRKFSALLLATTVLAACGTQTPAPIVAGKNQGGQVQEEAEYTPQVQQPLSQYVPNQRFHMVRSGESLLDISRQYEVSPADIALENNLARGQRLVVGQRLTIPTGAAAPQPLAPVTTRLSQQNTATVAPKVQAELVAPPTPVAKPQDVNEAVSAVVSVNADAPIRYDVYNVQPGDTLFRIGRRYGVSPFDLMAANDLERPQDLQAGTQLRVPQRGEAVDLAATQTQVQIDQSAARAQGIVWPVRDGKITARFGADGDGVKHTGITLAVPEGSPVLAVDTGTVIYAGDGLRTYGNLILLRHDNGLVTAYAHNSQLQVAKNQRVQKGQVIALSGASGQVNTPQLHFEVRRNARAIDPLTVLPKQN